MTRLANVLAIVRDTLLILIMVLALVLAGRLAAEVDKAVNEPRTAQPCLIDPQSAACLNAG
jgi:hypothetical protein